MSGVFSNRKKLILLANAIEANLNYVKNADDLFPQDQVAKAKYGMTMHGYLPDAGSTSKGLVAHPDKAHQVEVSTVCQNFNTAAEVDLWDTLMNIEDFRKEMVDKRSEKLSRDVQKVIIEQNVFRSCQAEVATSAGYALLSNASAKLDELSVVGDRVDFQTPTVFTKIAQTGANLFWPSDIQKETYEEMSLGEYANAASVKLPGLPVLDTTGATAAPTITGKAVKDSGGNYIGVKEIKAITAGTSGSIVPGVPYVLSGLSIVDEGGVETAQEYVVIPVKEVYFDEDGVEQERVVIPGLRITATGKAWGNPNAHIAATAIASADGGNGNCTFTLAPMTGIEIGSKYQVGQIRNVKALSFSKLKFDSLPAAKQDNVGVGEFISLKMQSAPVVLNGVSYFRIDLPFIATLFEPRQSVTTFLKLA